MVLTIICCISMLFVYNREQYHLCSLLLYTIFLVAVPTSSLIVGVGVCVGVEDGAPKPETLEDSTRKPQAPNLSGPLPPKP